MQSLVEVHDESEVESLCTARVHHRLNNRNLRTMELDLATTERLRPRIPPGRLVVSESGIRSRHDIAAPRLAPASMRFSWRGTYACRAMSQRK
jgi:indole-3-glycerol phosphate synthase